MIDVELVIVLVLVAMFIWVLLCVLFEHAAEAEDKDDK